MRWMRKLFKKRLSGIYMDLAFSPWTILFYGVALYLLGATGATVVKTLEVYGYTIEYARTAAIDPSLIDPTNGQPVPTEFSDAVSQVVPVNSSSITNSSVMPDPNSLSIGELNIDMYTNDGNYVTTTLAYGLTLPGTPLWDTIGFTPSVLPLHLTISFFREW